LKSSDNREKIKIGKITGAQGLRGEVRIYHDSADEEALKRLTSLFLGTGDAGGEFGAFPIEGLRMHKMTPILKLAGVDDRDAAEALVGSIVYADLCESRPSEEGAWLVSDLVGFEVRLAPAAPADAAPPADTADAAPWRLKNIIPGPGHDILEIETEKGVRMLPFVDVFVREIDMEEGKIVVAPPAGWQ